MILSKHIFFRLLLVFVPLLMALAPARAQNTVYAGHTTDLSVVQGSGDTYVWELYKEITGLNFAVTPGNCPPGEAYFVPLGGNTGPTVKVMWTTPGIYYFKVTATNAACPTMNLKVGKMIVLDSLPTAVITPPDPICAGDSAHLTVTLTGTAPWSITLTDGTNDFIFNNILTSPFNLTVPIIPLVNTTYWIKKVTDAVGTNETNSPSVLQVLKPKPTTSPIWHN
ncbi:MAG: hypothetical protein NTW16_05655 [Bacteroidetes bacterium]|nr:hypothetical protein [Bacteroidota bacterium]